MFVYGTLMRGQTNHNLLKDSRFIDKGVTRELFCLYDLGDIPVVTWDEVSPIHGELYRCDPKIFEFIDHLECTYERVEVPIVLPMSGTVKAWMYVADYEETEGILIREGKWR